jgi:hypothetical protein
MMSLVSTERMVSKKRLETGEVTSQPGSPGQPRVAPYQRDSPYLRVPPYFGVTVVGAGVVGAGFVVVVAGEVVEEVEQLIMNRLAITRIKAATNKYFFILSSCYFIKR